MLEQNINNNEIMMVLNNIQCHVYSSLALRSYISRAITMVPCIHSIAIVGVQLVLCNLNNYKKVEHLNLGKEVKKSSYQVAS